jgi:hypothetical protein
VDIHWDISERYFHVRRNPQSWWDPLAMTSLPGTLRRTFSSGPLLLILSIHNAKHNWERLSGICDIAALIHATTDFDWAQTLDWAVQSGQRRILLLTLLLAHDLLDAPLPELIHHQIKAEERLQFLYSKVVAQLLRQPPASSYMLGFWHRRCHALDRWQDGLAGFFQYLFIPSWVEWKTLPLPEAFYSLYYVWRPLRLLGETLRRF